MIKHKCILRFSIQLLGLSFLFLANNSFASSNEEKECHQMLSQINQRSNNLLTNQISLTKEYSQSLWIPKSTEDQFKSFINGNKEFAVKLSKVVNDYYINKNYNACLSKSIQYSSERIDVTSKIVLSDYEIMKNINKEKTDIIKDSLCKDEKSCNKALFEKYQLETEKKLQNYQDNITKIYQQSFKN